MCGIVGYVGKQKKIKAILSKLQNLEYRGYDSSGVAYYDGTIKIQKTVGTIDNIFSKIGEAQSNICISHTRWATHGKVNEQNAHPHVSFNKNFAVVHNGIIENYLKLKNKIGEDKFSSTTDTETIANLMETQQGTTLERLQKTTQQLIGSWAVLVIDCNGEKLYAAKNKSPLYAAKTSDGFLIASDITCFEKGEYYVFEDGMTAEISADTIKFFVGGKQVFPKVFFNQTEFAQTGKGDYKFFMEKEIDETPKVLQNLCKTYQNIIKQKQFLHLFDKKKKIILCGCGTAYHACSLGSRWIVRQRHIPAQAVVSSEMRYFGKISKNNLVVLLSQSGETADTLAVLEKAKKAKANVVAVTNCMHSTLATNADYVLPLCAGAEIAVASTKAYSAMLACLYLLSAKNSQNALKNLQKCAKTMQISKIDSQIVQKIASSKRIFFIGRGDDAVSALEGALKLKETSYLDSYGYYAGELKHGTIALVERGVSIIGIMTDQKTAEKTNNALNECASRGADIFCVGIGTQNNLIAKVDCKLPQAIKDIMVVIALQKLALMVADERGCNPDRPRNLAKSVTVE